MLTFNAPTAAQLATFNAGGARNIVAAVRDLRNTAAVTVSGVTLYPTLSECRSMLTFGMAMAVPHERVVEAFDTANGK